MLTDLAIWLFPIRMKTEFFGVFQSHQRLKNTERKLLKQNAERMHPRECDTIRFAFVLGEEGAFLIQNMFPITDTYIMKKYLNKSAGNTEVRIDPAAESDIISRAQKVLKLHRKGINLVFGDIDKIYLALQEELTVSNA